ncbi:MAG: hypothetical protein L3J73_02725, partial [Thermoplasmata archaeon]|nr:hypothetical protein [Thermoplasmata archaeon]
LGDAARQVLSISVIPPAPTGGLGGSGIQIWTLAAIGAAIVGVGCAGAYWFGRRRARPPP